MIGKVRDLVKRYYVVALLLCIVSPVILVLSIGLLFLWLAGGSRVAFEWVTARDKGENPTELEDDIRDEDVNKFQTQTMVDGQKGIESLSLPFNSLSLLFVKFFALSFPRSSVSLLFLEYPFISFHSSSPPFIPFHSR